MGNYFKTHGMSGTRFYKKWVGMHDRCNCKKQKAYKHYGARGITVEWKTFEDFARDMYVLYVWHVMIYGEKNTTIERRDNNKNYSKENCRWATYEEQGQNHSKLRMVNYKGEIINLTLLCRRENKNYKLVHSRLRAGWSIEKAMSTI